MMEQIPASWPAGLLRFVEQSWGDVRAVEPLSGLSGAKVWRLATDRQWAVVKQCSPSEARFYEAVAPRLRAAGVGVPELWWSGARARKRWVLIEYLPAAPLRSAWVGNPAWMRALARLHQLPLDVFAPLKAPYRPAWSEAMVEAALELVPQRRRQALRAHLGAVAAAVERLQGYVRPISGDPNPLNWGLRADGSAVLFDWERAGFGPPAFDLAITIPGLASDSAAQQVARAYLSAAAEVPPAPQAVAALARDIARCKVWVVVEFMAEAVERGMELGPAYGELWRAVPDWVARIARLTG
ncbi:MAG: aminoglycoside phosphotransferase family protein [Chloroflexota bacterium]